MTQCTCPADQRSVPSGDRVIVYEPDAETKNGHNVIRDVAKVHIFSKYCPTHGYTEINE